MSASSPDGAPKRRGRRPWMAAAAALLLIAAALVQVTTTGPRVSVRWAPSVDAAARARLEVQYSLSNGRSADGVWFYRLDDRSRDNVAALIEDPAVADTGYIDRTGLTAGEPEVAIGVRPLPFPFNADDQFRDRRQLFQPQSLCLLLAGAGLLVASAGGDPRRRRALAIAVLAAVAVAAYALPISGSLVHMGDVETYTSDPTSFEGYVGIREIRFEAHLSHAILGRVYQALGRAAASPDRAFDLLMRLATAWFVLCALGIGALEQWSPHVLRYLGLAVLAPSALLYFGYRELGQLSLNVAAFPLLARGLRDGSPRLEAGSVLAGLGAALHGFGVLSLAGACLAALAPGARLLDRGRALLAVVAWGTAAYVGWIAVYVIVLALPISQGHTDVIPWRPWLADVMVGDRVNVAILSATGARDLLFTAWVVGAPLVAVAASLWRRERDAVRLALVYTVPSIAFSIAFWPIQGLGVEMDLVAAAFPAVYALAWVCALDPRRTVVAAALLASGHLAFWRIVLDGRFVN